MKTKLLTAALAALMVLSMAACGGKDPAPASSAPAPSEEASSQEESSEIEVVEDGALDAEYEQYLRDNLAETYYGINDAGELFLYGSTETGDFAAMVIGNPDTNESASFVGEMTQESDTAFTISDEENGMTLTFEVVAAEGDVITIDLGDLGTAQLAPCSMDEFIEYLNTISVNTNAVA